MESQNNALKKIYKNYCKACDYYTDKKSSFNNHLLSRKHNWNTESIICNKNYAQKNEFMCINCNKIYNSRSSLSRHKKTCKPIENKNVPSTNIIDFFINENKDFKNMIMDLVKNNNDLQKQMIDVCEKIQPMTVNNTNSHNNNKTFNLQFFLNEECKDAMNMSEFIKSIELQLKDLEHFAEADYTQGMSNLIIKQLKNTDMYKRPVHCSDAKRETLYIKDENKWEKDDPENKKMVGVVRSFDKKNIDLLFQWKNEYPSCLNTDSPYNDHYIKLLRSVVSGSEENVNKVIKKVTKEVVIDK